MSTQTPALTSLRIKTILSAFRSEYVNLLYVVAAGITGLLVFTHPAFWLHSLLLLIPVFWARTTHRITAGLVLSVFAGAMSRGLPVSAEVFYGTTNAFWWGIAVLALLCLLFFVLGVICWHPNPHQRILRIALLVLLWTLPPFGLIGWGNPLLAAGWLFPDWHWTGLIALILLMMLIAWRFSFMIIPLFLLVIHQNHPLPQATDWQSHHTHYPFGVEAQTRDLKAEYQRHRAMSKQLQTAGNHVSVHLYPETVGGEWNPMASTYWQRQLQNAGKQNRKKTVLIGASTYESGQRYNSVVAINSQQANVVYRQRVPVPGVMWNPWLKNAYASGQGQPSVININGRRTAFLICYETLLSFPVLQSLFYQPEHLAIVASVWWAPDNVIRAQQAAARSWARLFGLSLSEAYNR